MPFRSSLSRPGSVGTSDPVWWSAPVPAGSPPAHHPHCNICSVGPHCQRWEQTPALQLQWSFFFNCLKQKCWRKVPCPAIEHSVLWTQNHKTSSVPFGLQTRLLYLEPFFSVFMCFFSLYHKVYNYCILSLSLNFLSQVSVFTFSVASAETSRTTHRSVVLHSLAVTGPETGYLWLIGTKTSLKVYL